MKGYKAFYFDLTCRPTDMAAFQYEIGVTYKIEEHPIICERGFHFCPALGDVYEYYPSRFDIRVCEVESLGDCEWGICPSCVHPGSSSKVVTNKLRIIRELEPGDIMTVMNDVHNYSLDIMDIMNDVPSYPLDKMASTLPSIRRSIRVFSNAPLVYALWEDDRGFQRYPKDDRETQWLRQRAQLWTDALSATKTNKEAKKE